MSTPRRAPIDTTKVTTRVARGGADHAARPSVVHKVQTTAPPVKKTTPTTQTRMTAPPLRRGPR